MFSEPNRLIMKPYGLLIGLLLVVVACSTKDDKSRYNLPHSLEAGPGEELASGCVFHDKNGNRMKDDGERGISGVLVSNGTKLVQTDANGDYAIPVSDDAIVFVIKPKDWMTPVNEQNLPQFYYLHKPKGSPEYLRYKGVDPTGDLPEEINFPLYPENASEAFKMVVFGDPQPYNIQQIDYLAEDIVLELIGRDDLEFGMTMGDIVGNSLDLFSPLNQAVSMIGIPWYNVLGNHDVNYLAPNDRLSDETYERVFGPATYAFEYGEVHFIVVDDVIHTSESGSTSYVGGLRPDQFEFVSNYLQTVPREDLVVLTMHIPLAQHGEAFRKSDQKKLFDLLKKFPHTLSISAHSHVHENMHFHADSSDWQQPVPHHHFNVGTASGSWWSGLKGETDVPHTMMRDGTPNGYSFISFKGTEYIIDWKVAGSPDDHRMNIHVPRGIIAGSADTVLLSVNFFNGSEESSLEYRIKGLSDWKTMDKVEKPDPYYEMIYKRWLTFEEMGYAKIIEENPNLSLDDFPGRPLTPPQNSSHMWEASIGTDWPAGRHIIEVRARDRYDRTFTAFHTMRVEPN